MSKPSVVYGIDVGGTAVKIGRFEQGVLCEKFSIPTDLRERGRFILPQIATALSKADAVGLAVPGPVEVDGRVNGCTNLGWGLCDAAGDLRALTGAACVCCNDASAAALGEQWQGAGRGYDACLTVTLGTGIGAGFVLDGKLLSGAHGAMGEIGHLSMNPDEPEACSCGLHGCLEQYASATGLCRLARRAGLGALSAQEICDRAKAGDAAAGEVLAECCRILGRGLAMAACALDPAAIVLGGGLSQAGEYLRLRTQSAFRAFAFHACRSTHILLAQLGNDAGIYGAAKYAADALAAET